MSLSDTRIRGLKPGPKLVKHSDGDSLFLYVRPSGTKSWVFEYRYAGRPKTLSIGVYPSVSLSDARESRNAARKLLAKGGDPSQAKQKAKQALEWANENTFGAVAEDYLKNFTPGHAPASVKKNRWMLMTVAGPLAQRPISDIEPDEVISMLEKVQARGNFDAAVATLGAIKRVFSRAHRKKLVHFDPTAFLRKDLRSPKPKSHAGLKDPAKVGGLMRAIYGHEGWVPLRAAMKFQALTFARPGETLQMVWSEVDLSRRIWTMAATRTKQRREHMVPLSTQALGVLKEMAAEYGKGDQVFPSMMAGKRFMSASSINSALRRMGYSHEEQTGRNYPPPCGGLGSLNPWGYGPW